jgi:hypothetical protein
MEHQTERVQLVWWHSLIYTTGWGLLVCSPGTVVLALNFVWTGDLDRSQALLFSGCMVGAELFIALLLLVVAEQITKRRYRKE